MPPRRSTKAATTALSTATRIAVLYGAEAMLIREKFDALRAAIEAEHGPVEPTVFDGKTCQLADVLDEVRTLSLMASHSLVVVDEADEFVKRYREPMERYAAEPCESGTLVLRGTTWNKGNLDKAIEKVGAIVKCEALSHADASAWLVARAHDVHEAKLDPRAAAALVERVGAALGLLDSELGKLAVMCPPGEPITVDMVEQAVGRGSDEQAWAVQEAMISAIATGQAKPALEKLYEVVELAGHPVELVSWAAMDLCRKLGHAATMRAAGQNDFTICKALRIWPASRQGPFMAAVKKLDARAAPRLMNLAVAADRRAKSGYGDMRRNLEGFCVRAADIAR